MSNETPEIPSVPGTPTSRRGLAYSALLSIASDLILARFALARALDKLATNDILDLLDEVAETLDNNLSSHYSKIATLRNRKGD